MLGSDNRWSRQMTYCYCKCILHSYYDLFLSLTSYKY